MAKQNSMDASGECLVNNPMVGFHPCLIEAQHRKRRDDGRCPVARLGWTGIGQTAHEVAERDKVEHPVLHFVIDVVTGGCGIFLPLLVAASVG
jgi:hypothetical protein